MIKYVTILTLMYIVFPVNSIAQCVSIELSIEWKHSKNDFLLKELNKKDSACNPYLLIKYRNNTDKNIYFLRPTGTGNNYNKYPDVISTVLISPKLSLSKRARKFSDYSSENYTVIMDLGISHYLYSWSIFRGIDNQSNNASAISYDLSNIYKYLSKDKNRLLNNDSSIYVNYQSSDINEKGILDKLKHKFIFLDKGEVYTERYDLLGFNLVKGNFYFDFKYDRLPSFVYTDSRYSEEKEKWIHSKTKLPEKVSNYSLFKGKIHSNKIILEIE